ncbi:hypothetical protein ES703_89600 [subsurface metagenome]
MDCSFSSWLGAEHTKRLSRTEYLSPGLRSGDKCFLPSVVTRKHDEYRGLNWWWSWLLSCQPPIAAEVQIEYDVGQLDLILNCANVADDIQSFVQNSIQDFAVRNPLLSLRPSCPSLPRSDHLH